MAHGRPDTPWAFLGAAVEAAVKEGSPRPVPIKLHAIPPPLEHLVPLTQLYVLRSASLSQSPHSLLETGDLVSIASTRCQPITHSHPDESTFGLDFSALEIFKFLGHLTTRLCRSIHSVYDGLAGGDG